MSHSFLWIGPISGDWDVASNWEDLTLGVTATIAPGNLDSAIVPDAVTQLQTIAGPGSALSLSLSDSAVIGTINVGSLEVDDGTLDIGIGATVTAGGATVDALEGPRNPGDAEIAVSGDGAVLTITGTLAFSNSYSEISLIANHGATVTVGSLSISGGESTIQVDSASAVEVGSSGSAVAGSVAIDGGATFAVGGFNNSIDANVADNGMLAVAAEAWIGLQGTLSGGGEVSAGDDSRLAIAAIAKDGPTIKLGSDSSTLIDGMVGVGSTIAMIGSNNILTLSDLGAFAGTVSGLDQTDTLEVNGSITSAVYTPGSGASGTLALFDTTTQVGTVTLIGNYTGLPFQPIPTGNPATTAIVLEGTAPCFARGTRIATDRGEIPVERLHIGDQVHLVSGGAAPIVWIGQRGIECNRHPMPHHVWPVRVRRSAFGPGMPSRDLFLSPDHSVFAEDVLIPIKYLRNQSTIQQMPCESVEYYHLELSTHDILLAEDLPVESYLDTGDRCSFENYGRVVTLFPDFWLRREAYGYAPLAITGPSFEAVRQRLHARAMVLHEAVPLPTGTRTLQLAPVYHRKTGSRRRAV